MNYKVANKVDILDSYLRYCNHIPYVYTKPRDYPNLSNMQLIFKSFGYTINDSLVWYYYYLHNLIVFWVPVSHE